MIDVRSAFKAALTLTVATSFALVPSVCLGAVYESAGFKLTVPQEYDPLLETKLLLGKEGKFFRVSEKASIESAKRQKMEYDHVGHLFTIGRVPKEKLRAMLCSDMSGAEYFAKDAAGNCYMFYHPTDVRYVRDDLLTMRRDQDVWRDLNAWSHNTVRQNFLKDNPGLSPETADNSSIGIYLANLMYGSGAKYSLTSKEKNIPGEGFQAEPYAKNCLYNASFHMDDGKDFKNGEYISLNIPQDNVRLDFFTSPDLNNYVREVRSNLPPLIYKGALQKGKRSVGEYAYEWFEALNVHREMKSRGVTPDALLGSWAEKIAGRGVITITKGKEKNTYDVSIHWSGSAVEKHIWTMTARPVSSHAIHYENGKYSVLIFSEKGLEKETLKYKNGIGTFTLNSANEIMWDDETGNAGADTVFISTGTER